MRWITGFARVRTIKAYRLAGKRFLEFWEHRHFGNMPGFDTAFKRWRYLEQQFSKLGFQPVPLRLFTTNFQPKALGKAEKPILWADVHAYILSQERLRPLSVNQPDSGTIKDGTPDRQA